jgi:hypothetical protein
MLSKEFGQFLVSLVIFTMVALLLSVAFTPPDPFTQAVAWLAAQPVVVVGSYYLAYTLGYEWT